MDYLVIRCLCSFLVGVILSQTGSLIQMTSRNILASPSTLGFDGLSVLWVLVFHSLMMLFQVDHSSVLTFMLGVPLFILFAKIYVFLVGKNQHVGKIIFIGLSFNLLIGAIFSLWHFLFLAFNLPFPGELWFGHFRFSRLIEMEILFLVECALLVSGLIFRKTIILYSLGDSIASNLSLNIKKLLLYSFMAVAVATLCVVSLFGAFSFLGLIFPILSRRLWLRRFDLKGEFIWGAFFNGAVLMLIDYLCYSFPIMGAEVPVGLVATTIGALSLIGLMWNSDNRLEILAKR